MISGSKWWKFDFHCHTMGSDDYKDKDILARDWLLAQMNKEIDCVAITDHNSGFLIDVLKQELELMRKENVEGYRELTLFPGVELSITGGFHLLALFDPQCNKEDIDKIIHKADYNGTIGCSDGVTNKSFTEVIDIINSNNGIAIPAHVDKESGLFTVRKGTTLKTDLKAKPLLAMQVCDFSYVEPQVYKESNLNLTKIRGSDSHSLDTIGSNYSWVKMQNADINSLKLALHDGDDGINNNIDSKPNDLSSRFYIKNIKIENTLKMGNGKPAIIEFSPWLNSIIGGRGSGKSSVINFLRMVTNNRDFPEESQIKFDEFSQSYDKETGLGMMRDNSSIECELYTDETAIKLVYKDGVIQEFKKDENQNWIIEDFIGNIEERFPIRIFSQKQIYNMTKDSISVIQLIDKYIEKSKWEQDKNDILSKYISIKSDIKTTKTKLDYLKERKAQLRDITRKINVFETKMTPELRLNRDKFLKIDKSLDQYFQATGKILDTIENQPLELEAKFLDELDPISASLLKSFDEKWKNYSVMIKNFTTEMKKDFTEVQSELILSPYTKDKEANQNEYRKIIDELEKEGISTSVVEIENLLKEQEQLQTEIEEIDNIEMELNKLRISSEELFQTYVLHEKSLRAMRNEVIETWNEKNKALRIQLIELGNEKIAESTLRSLIGNDKPKFQKDIFDKDTSKKGLLDRFYSSEDKWEAQKILVSRVLESDSIQTNDLSKIFIKNLTQWRSNNIENVAKLETWFPEDDVQLTLLVDKREQNIKAGSEGERTAAMLSLLLSLEDTPIVIDQPEDDLDTRRITDLVVTGIRSVKERQQIIVITHNPNIPVNGSAEQVIQMNFAGGQINVHASGGLQDENIREAICDVMEGGREAFNNRYQRVFNALN